MPTLCERGAIWGDPRKEATGGKSVKIRIKGEELTMGGGELLCAGQNHVVVKFVNCVGRLVWTNQS